MKSLPVRRSLADRLLAPLLSGLIAYGPIAPAFAQTDGTAKRGAVEANASSDFPGSPLVEPVTQAPVTSFSSPSSIPLRSPPPNADLGPVALLPRDVEVRTADDWTLPSPAGWALFDGRLRETLPSDRPLRIRVMLDKEHAFEGIRTFGPAGGRLSVAIESEGHLVPIPGLESVPLAGLAEHWNRFSAQQPVLASSLVLSWVPDGSGARGLREIELWGLGPRGHVGRDGELGDRILSGTVEGALLGKATPAERVITRVPFGNDPSDTFRLNLPFESSAVDRVFLVYELSGMPHWSAIAREINGSESRAVFQQAPGGDGGLQVEEIAPSWIHRGENTIRFLPTDDMTKPGYRVRNLRIVGLPHGRSIDVVRGLLGSPRKGAEPSLVRFEAKTQAHELSFRLEAKTDGVLKVRSEQSTSKKARTGRGEVTLGLGGLDPGVHRIPLDGLPPAEAFALERTDGKEAPVRVHDPVLTGSPLPSDEAEPKLAISFPLHGECVDHATFVRGFATVVDSSGPVSLTINGEPATEALAFDGSFGLRIPEPGRARGKAWHVDIKAAYPNGKVLERSVRVGPCIELPAPTIDRKGGEARSLVEDKGAPFGEVVRAGEAKTLAFGGTILEIPKGAIDKDVRITVRPLVEGQLPKIDRLMRNVTPGGRGFRFGPHGLSFKKPIKVTLPYVRRRRDSSGSGGGRRPWLLF